MKYLFLYFKLALFFTLLLNAPTLYAQFYKDIFSQKGKDDPGFSDEQQQLILKKLHADIKYLSSDKLEGRRTGTKGEQLTGIYIQNRMIETGLSGYRNNFRHIFKFVSGKQITPESRFTIARKFIFIPEEAFPAPFSAAGSDRNYILPGSKESYGPWLLPLYPSAAEANDPGFDWRTSAYARAKNAEDRGATSVIFYDEYGSRYAPSFSTESVFQPLAIPVIIMLKKAYDEHLKGTTVMKSLELTIKFKNQYDEGNNVIGYIDNSAPLTVVIAAHYDHLGHGEDMNILNGRDIYNGANDNASGVAVMLALASEIRNARFTKYNYIFAAFSGEEQGMLGSKAFVSSNDFNPGQIAFMINLDKVGIPDIKNKLFIGGTETSYSWNRLLGMVSSRFKIIKETLSDIGMSDYVPFYEDSIPVLSFTTGSYANYHKPTDDFQGINYPAATSVVQYVYDLIAKMEQQSSAPKFGIVPVTAAKAATSPVPAKEPLGIGPDESYKGIGVRIEKTFEGSAAFNAHMKSGDIILQVDKHKINGMKDYKSAIGNLNRGDTTIITVKRGPTVQKFSLVF